MSYEADRDELLTLALGYPGAYKETPWGEIVIKVNKKIFVFVGATAEKLTCTVKLPRSSLAALTLPFTSPTGYGLGKSGWVTAAFTDGDDAPVELLAEWMDESYRAVAPKRSIKELDAGTPREATVEVEPLADQPSILLAGEDGARLERARDGLRGRGLIEVSTASYATLPTLPGRFDLLVLDVNRRFTEGLDLATTLPGDERFLRSILTGVRDARLARKVKSALGPEVSAYKQAPGEPAMVSAIVELAT